MTPVLVFDIETIPDVDGIRRINDIGDTVDDAGVLDWYGQRRRATSSSGSDFAPLYLQKVVAIGCALRDATGLRVWSVGDVDDSEPELIRRFFDGIERFTPQLVSWNGGGFDLPVLHHRALLHGVQAARYWDWGDNDRDFRFNNYLSRYHTRHLDVMDVLACYQPRASAGLDAVARLCGFPGKLGMDGSAVGAAIAAGRIAEVRSYCETDVINTYLVFQRFRLMRGEIDAGGYAAELSLVRERLAALNLPHWREFLAAWDARGGRPIEAPPRVGPPRDPGTRGPAPAAGTPGDLAPADAMASDAAPADTTASDDAPADTTARDEAPETTASDETPAEATASDVAPAQRQLIP